MAPFSPSLNALRAVLAEVSGPEALPRAYCRYLGKGSFVTAYRIGRFVVKDTGGTFDASPEDWEEARAFDIRRAPTVLASARHGQMFKIQVYRPSVASVFGDAAWDRYAYYQTSAYSGRWPGNLDFHAKNVGVDDRVRFIAFDW